MKNLKITPYVQYIQKLCRRFCNIEFRHTPMTHVEAKTDGLLWYFDIKKYLQTGTYHENATFNQTKSIRRITLNFFSSGEILYKRTPDLDLLRCVVASEAAKIHEQIHARVCGTHINGFTLARKNL